MHKGFFSENPLAVNMLTSPKNSWNLQKTLLSFFFIILSQIELEKVLFSQIRDFRILDSTFPANYQISRANRENLPSPIQIKLSKKPEIFWCIFFAFLKPTLNLQCSENKAILIAQVFLKLLTPRDVLI